MERRTKVWVVDNFAARMGITRSESERQINGLIHLIYEELAKGNKVNISDFGCFSVSHRRAREGVNPRNPSQRIIIPKLNTPKFRAGESFKGAVALRH